MGNGAAKAKSSGAEKKLDSAEIERHDGKSETRRRLFFFDAAGRRLLGRHRLGLCSIPSALHRGVSVSPSMAQR